MQSAVESDVTWATAMLSRVSELDNVSKSEYTPTIMGNFNYLFLSPGAIEKEYDVI